VPGADRIQQAEEPLLVCRGKHGDGFPVRGVDRVVNAVGPALRRHGVLVVPVRVFDVEYKETRTTNN